MTREQAIALKLGQEVHLRHCTRSIGPRGGVKEDVCRLRVTGRVKLWKTRPGNFKVPVKYGLRDSMYIEPFNLEQFHLPEECPLNQTDGPVTPGKDHA